MSLLYKCDFYGTTEGDESKYPEERTRTITGLTINGVDYEMDVTIKLKIPTISGKIHVNAAAWKQVARDLEAWLTATFPP